MHFYKDTSKTPHVYSNTIREPKDYLWTSIKTTLNVGVHSFCRFARGPEVNDLDTTSFGTPVMIRVQG